MIPSACYGRPFFLYRRPSSIFPQPHSSLPSLYHHLYYYNDHYTFTYATPCRILLPKADSKFADPWFIPVNPSIMLTHRLQLPSPRRPVSSPAAADAVPATAASGVLWRQGAWLSHRLVSIILSGSLQVDRTEDRTEQNRTERADSTSIAAMCCCFLCEETCECCIDMVECLCCGC